MLQDCLSAFSWDLSCTAGRKDGETGKRENIDINIDIYPYEPGDLQEWAAALKRKISTKLQNKENDAVLKSVSERKEKLPGKISESRSGKRRSLQNSINRPS
jgi:hypothetical protein